MQKTNINGSALVCALFFLFMPAFGISITTIQNFPNDIIAGSIYEAKFSFNSDLADNYKVFINISNVGENESSISDCVEIQAGQFVCERRMVNGLNTLSLYLNFSPYIAPEGYPISIIFSIPYDDGITETQITSSSTTGGGGTFFFPLVAKHNLEKEEPLPPPPPVKEEPIKKEPKNESDWIINESENITHILNISIPAELINITNYTNNQTINITSENTISNPLSMLIFIMFIILLCIAGYFIFNSKNPPPEQPITEVML